MKTTTEKFFATSIKHAKHRSVLKGIAFDHQVTASYLAGLYDGQNGRCALTGVPMSLTRGGDWYGGKNPFVCSMDCRLTPANRQMRRDTCSHVNLLKRWTRLSAVLDHPQMSAIAFSEKDMVFDGTQWIWMGTVGDDVVVLLRFLVCTRSSRSHTMWYLPNFYYFLATYLGKSAVMLSRSEVPHNHVGGNSRSDGTPTTTR